MISKALYSFWMNFPGVNCRRLGFLVTLAVLSLGLYAPSNALAQHLDMSGEWLVKMANADSCSALFDMDGSSPRLNDETNAWVTGNGQFEGQTEYYLGESAYKCSFNSSSPRAFITLSLGFFESALALQVGQNDELPLAADQELKLYFRKAWAQFRAIELNAPSDMKAMKRSLQNLQADLKFGGVLDNAGSFGIAGQYLNLTATSLLNRIDYYEAIAGGPETTQAALPSLMKNSQNVYGAFSDLSGRPLPQDSGVDIDPDQFPEAIRYSRLGELLFLAQLQVQAGVEAQETFQLVENYLGSTPLDAVYKFQSDHLSRVAKGDNLASQRLNTLFSAVPADGNGFRDLLGVLLGLESMDSRRLFQNMGSNSNRDPRVSYWLANAQALLGPDRVEEIGATYQPKLLLAAFLQSTPVLGDAALRENARMLLMEIAFNEAVRKSGNPSMTSLNAINDQLGAFYPDNTELEGRKSILQEMLAVYGVEVLSLAWGTEMDEDMIISLVKAASIAPSDRLSRRFLTKATEWLDSLDGDEDFGGDKWKFYAAVLAKAGARRSGSRDDSIAKLNRCIEYADSIPASSPYSSEGKYLAALAAKELFYFDARPEVREAAVDRLIRVVQEEKNVRALYYLAGELDGGVHNLEAAQYAHMVKTVIKRDLRIGAENNQFYRWTDGLFSGYLPQESIVVGPENGTTILASELHFPNATLPNGMYLEQFANAEFLKAAKSKDFLKSIALHYPLAPLPYYSANIFEGSWLANQSYSGVSSGIREGAKKEMSGLMMTVTAPSAFVRLDNVGLTPDPEFGFYEKKNIDIGTIMDLLVTSPGYFDFHTDHKFSGSPYDKGLRYLYLAEKTQYKYEEKVPEATVAVYSQGNKVYLGSGNTCPDFLKQRLGYEARDFAQLGNFYYCVNVKNNTIDRIPTDGKGSANPIVIGSQSSLLSPEGIAIDREGNIYVADFAGNEIVVFSPDGKELNRFGGTTGENSLHFPTRLALEEDAELNQHGEDSFRRPGFLYVSDWDGIHRFDLFGHKIDTVVKAGDQGIDVGEFYGIGIVGYGVDAELIVLDRSGKSAFIFEASKTQ